MSNKTRGALAILAAGALTLSMAPSAFAQVKDDADPWAAYVTNEPGVHRIADKDRISTAIEAAQSRDWGTTKLLKNKWQCENPNAPQHDQQTNQPLGAKQQFTFYQGKERLPVQVTCTVVEDKTKDHVNIIIARSDDYADALAATPLADVLDAPVLINPTAGLDPRNANEIKRLSQKYGKDRTIVHILGGTAALSHDVENAVDAIIDTTSKQPNTLRYQGIDRYETAVNIARVTIGWYGIDSGANKYNANVYVTTGQNFPDALAAGAAAAHNDGIVLLTNGDNMDRRGITERFIWNLNDWVSDTYGATGYQGAPMPKDPSQVKEDVSTELAEVLTMLWAAQSNRASFQNFNTNEVIAVGGPSDRALKAADINVAKSFVGKDRYETATLTASGTFKQHNTDDTLDTKNYAVVSGQSYADALVASAYIANSDGPLLLSHSDRLTPVTAQYLNDNVDELDRVFTFGGTGTLQNSVTDAIKKLLDY